MNTDMQSMLISRCEATLKDTDSIFDNNYSLVDMDSIANVNKRALTEMHLISNEFENSDSKRAVIINNDQTVSIMIDEEDHFRIQCIMSGLAIDDCYSLADEIDNYLDKKLHFAFHEKYGYLTKCPTNVGTGLRISVMMNLPALFVSGKMATIIPSLAKLGLTVRGLYGEGSLPYGNIYQISNQVTLGLNEQEIIEKISNIAKQLIENERNTRTERYSTRRDTVEDYCFRCLGILKTARLISSNEIINLLSGIRYGVSVGALPFVDYAILNELMVVTQVANVMKNYNDDSMSEQQRDVLRATIVREKLEHVKI